MKPTLFTSAVVAIAIVLLVPFYSHGALTLPPIYQMSAIFGSPKFANGSPPCTAPDTINGTGGQANACQQWAGRSLVDGWLAFLQWTQGNSSGGIDVGVESTSVPGSYSFTNWYGSQSIGFLAGQTCGSQLASGGHSCWFAIATGLFNAPNSPMAPQYVFADFNSSGGGNWADASAYRYGTSLPYLPGETVVFNGQYYKLGGTSYCIPIVPGQPGNDGCAWGTATAHASPLNVASCAGFTGNNLPAGATYNIDATTCGAGSTQCQLSDIQSGVVSALEQQARVAFVKFVDAWMLDLVTNHSTVYAQTKYHRHMIGKAGESNPITCEAQFETLYGMNQTQYEAVYALALDKVQAQLTAYAKQIGFAIPFDLAFSSTTNTNADALAAVGAKYGEGLGFEGLKAGCAPVGSCEGVPPNAYQPGQDILALYNNTIANANNDWINVFQTYNGSNSAVPLFHMQEFVQSMPDYSSSSAQGLCNLTFAGGSTCGGSLQQMYPFAALFRGTKPIYMEYWWQDPTCGGDIGGVFSSPACPILGYSTYIGVFTSLSHGVPAPRVGYTLY